MLKQKYCQIKPTWWVCGAQFLSKYARCHRPYLPPRWLPSATGLRGLFAPPTTKRTGQKGTKKRTEERHSENTESLNKSTLKKKTWDGNRVFALTFALKRSIRWWCICYKFPHLTKRLSAQWLGILCCLWMTNQHFDRAKEMVFSMKFQFHIVLVLLKWCQRDTNWKRQAGSILNSELTFLPFAPATAAPAVRAASCEAWPWRFRKSLMSFKLRERPVPS